ncbi:glycoside hydrolase [Kalaharituber pfeilii]|nr:glycoside hydrolase [Kalaharituber pfeilii]
MHLFKLFRALTLLPFITQSVLAQERAVFAHFMHGLTASYNVDAWQRDISEAKAAGIDGFALNIGPHDDWTEPQLDAAYSVAEQLGFKLLISFDQLCCGPWDVNEVSRIINKYKNHNAQYKVNGLPFVSTFEGTDFIDRWAEVRGATGGIYLVPDWASLGPRDFAPHVGKVDGTFPWDAWSITHQQKTTDQDRAWLDVLGEKAYMMAVSPWFYTSLTQFNKNWIWKGDSLWFTRWEQVLDLLPDFVEIITWNDFGESHYIGPIRPESIVQGANKYIDNMPHDGWRFLLPYYISAYKAGTRDVPVSQEGVVYWYRRTQKNTCSNGGTTCSPPGYPAQFPAADCADDAVFVTSLSKEPAEIEIWIGAVLVSRGNVGRGAGFFQATFDGKIGPVTVKLIRNGQVITEGTGETIIGDCPEGLTNWNAWVGVAKA